MLKCETCKGAGVVNYIDIYNNEKDLCSHCINSYTCPSCSTHLMKLPQWTKKDTDNHLKFIIGGVFEFDCPVCEFHLEF